MNEELERFRTALRKIAGMDYEDSEKAKASIFDAILIARTALVTPEKYIQELEDMIEKKEISIHAALNRAYGYASYRLY